MAILLMTNQATSSFGITEQWYPWNEPVLTRDELENARNHDNSDAARAFDLALPLSSPLRDCLGRYGETSGYQGSGLLNHGGHFLENSSQIDERLAGVANEDGPSDKDTGDKSGKSEGKTGEQNDTKGDKDVQDANDKDCVTVTVGVGVGVGVNASISVSKEFCDKPSVTESKSTDNKETGKDTGDKNKSECNPNHHK